jgi:hypothetical protein
LSRSFARLMPLPPVPQASDRSSRLHAAATLSILILITLLVPFVIPVANARRHELPPPPTYLPALEGPRQRHEFETTRVQELRTMQPGYVVIGDSMAGTRIDDRRLGQLTGLRVAPLLQAASGPAFWYLALKNWVIASDIKPRIVFIFFRDTNLTDVMFRLDQQFRWSIDLVASDREDELNAVVARRLGPLHRAHNLIGRAFEVERARRWAEPALTNWPARVLIPSRRRRTEFTAQMNERLGLAHLRPMDTADIQVTEDATVDFYRYVDVSVLPLMLREAERAGLTLGFVRVQRRPTPNRPPAQSDAMRRYVDDLREYVTARGALFHDDTGDPALTIDLYEDGDHIARHARRFYTEIFFVRLRSHFQ